MLIKTFREKDIYPDSQRAEAGDFTERITGKVVLFDAEGRIALVGRSAHPYLLLPGGGIDEGESLEEGTLRECKEETGCCAELGEKVGIVDDYRLRDMKHCVTHCFLAKVTGEKGELSLTEGEVASGLYVTWVLPAEAGLILEKQLQDLQEGKVGFYNAGFNIRRDFLFLQEVLKKETMSDSRLYIGKEVRVIIDRPIGSKHPKHDMIYSLNYGYVPGTLSPDGEELDAYIIGPEEPVDEFTGRCVAVIRRINDDDDKLVVVPEELRRISDAEIREKTGFQEKFFTSVIMR